MLDAVDRRFDVTITCRPVGIVLGLAKSASAPTSGITRTLSGIFAGANRYLMFRVLSLSNIVISTIPKHVCDSLKMLYAV